MHGLCQPRPCTADHVLIYLAYAIVAIRHLNIICLTTANFKPPILPVLGFTLTNVVSIFTVMMTSACYLHNFVIKSFTYGTLKATCNLQLGVCLGNLPIV